MSGAIGTGPRSIQIGTYYVVMGNMKPEEITRITLDIYQKWMEFALGKRVLNGKMITHPTGRYARSLQVRWEDGIAVGVIADASIAPEAAYIEYGHASVDLKTKLRHGRAYPMHRTTGLPARVGGGPNGRRDMMWSQVRTRAFSGFASIGPNSAPDSWVIPSMPAYSPAATLAAVLSAAVRGGR